MITRTVPVIAGVDLSDYDKGPVTSEGYPRGAKSLADWICDNFGLPTNKYDNTYEFRNENTTTGIVFLKGPKDCADHIDVWNGKKSGSGLYTSIYVWFWEIK